jgi:alpha-L-rhamnosidase
VSKSTNPRVSVVGLKADYLDRPLGLENAHPRFSWRLESKERGVYQSRYRIRVASSEAALEAGQGDLWDSGEVSSRRSFGIEYQGRKPASRERCWWCVQVWDERGIASAPSRPSWWEMGLLDPQDWTAKWLAVEDQLSKADRVAGLQWIWGRPTEEKGSRKFRCKFQLPAAATRGELFAVAERPYYQEITGLWVDGVALDESSHELAERSLALGSLPAGEHLIAIEVTPHEFPGVGPQSASVDGITVFARFELAIGGVYRIGAGPTWKTSLCRDTDWRELSYDDRAWDAAQPAAISKYQPWPPSPAMYLRRQFLLTKPIAKARLYATALGIYEARLNGCRVGDALLTPEISQYAARVLYRVYDVSSLLRRGANAIGFIVGDGWYASWGGNYSWGCAPRRVVAQLELTFTDGS